MPDLTEQLDRIKRTERHRYFNKQRHFLSKAREYLDQVSSAEVIDDVIPIRIKLTDLIHRLDEVEHAEICGEQQHG